MSRWAVLLTVLGTMAGCSTLGPPSRPSVVDANPAMMPRGQAARNQGSVQGSPYQEVARARYAQPDDPVAGSSSSETASARRSMESRVFEERPAADSKPMVADLTSDPLGPLPKVRLLTNALRTPEMENPEVASRGQEPQRARPTKLPEPAPRASTARSLPDIGSLPRDGETTQMVARGPDAPLPPVAGGDEKVGSLETAGGAQDNGLVTVTAKAEVPAGPTNSAAKPESGDRPCARFVGGIDAEPSDAEAGARSAPLAQGVVVQKVPAMRCLPISAPPAEGETAGKLNYSSLPGSLEPTGRGEASLPDVSATASGVRFVNSKRFRLNYEVKDVGPSGIAGVELWYTQDGRSWQKHDSMPHQHSPYVVEVGNEDLYGFTLLVRSGAGVGKQPPRPGDLPQVWVEADVTRPVVRLLGTEPDTGSRAGSLTILWTASDKNLAQEPITISYAEQAAGPWVPIATRLPNSGRYVWQIPPGMPVRFLVRVEAADQAGNVGTDQSPSPLLGDPAQPTVAIVNVEPARK
ncbi:MAG TPA: hypothetical protein VG013_38295 [Gemmataceae bacterium]|jgi:hypothetical protein|nr:hypothetical protein [Gemmataceae bacterium]